MTQNVVKSNHGSKDKSHKDRSPKDRSPKDRSPKDRYAKVSSNFSARDSQHLIQLNEYMKYDRRHGALNYQYDLREGVIPLMEEIRDQDLMLLENIDLMDTKKYVKTLDMENPYDLLLYLVLTCNHSFKTIQYYLPDLRCKSLKAVLNLCFSPQMVFNLDYVDPELDVLADIFNNLVYSGRRNLHCYDCGTTARGVFYNLIKANRGRFKLTTPEIFQVRKDYYYDTKNKFTSLQSFIQDLRKTDKDTVFIVGIKFGDNLFGHIFVAEVLYTKGKKVIRFYQSALNSYLLID